jgi:hypothetical protein
MDSVGGSNGNPRSYAPMEKALAHLGFTMPEIVKKYKQGGYRFMTMPFQT